MSPVQANTRMSDRRGTRAMSLRIRLPPSEGRVEGSRDAEDLVDPPGAAIDGDDEQVTGDPARAGLGRDRREREAPRRVAVREAGELDRLPLAVEKEDPRPLAVGDEEMARRADRRPVAYPLRTARPARRASDTRPRPSGRDRRW